MPWLNQHSGQIKTVVGIIKIRHPTTPPAIIISNQKTDIPPEELCYREKGKQAEQLQELQKINLVSCGDKNTKKFIEGNLKYKLTVWQKITSDQELHPHAEGRLSPIVFQRILEVFYCKPEIDLFASCMNYQ